jgi:hypothetical protein
MRSFLIAAKVEDNSVPWNYSFDIQVLPLACIQVVVYVLKKVMSIYMSVCLENAVDCLSEYDVAII